MDFERRIQEAQQYVDQTKGAYDAAKQQTGQAQSDYNESFTTAPAYQTELEKAKLSQEQLYEVDTLKSQWEEAKSQVESIKTTIDQLPQSVIGGFRSSGIMISEDRYRKSLNQQNKALSNQFNQYNANYQLSDVQYKNAVDKAFSSSIDIANKNYDNYWNLVRVKMDKWQQSIQNEAKWEDYYYTSRSQLQQQEVAFDNFKTQQETIRMAYELERWKQQYYISNLDSQMQLQKDSLNRSIESEKAASEKALLIANAKRVGSEGGSIYNVVKGIV